MNNNLDLMKARLQMRGGISQQERMIKDKRKTLDDVRNDVAKILANNKKTETPKIEIPVTDVKADSGEAVKYIVRKAWNDLSSQIGAYINLDNAKKARDSAGDEYEVYDIINGDLVYPVASGSEDF